MSRATDQQETQNPQEQQPQGEQQPQEPRRRNGEPFPCTNLADALIELRRPFSPYAVRFKIQGGKTVVAYINARAFRARLNLVAGPNWESSYRDSPLQNHIECILTLFGVSRSDVGKGTGGRDNGKGMYSDSQKRAGVHFDIGASLYAAPKMYVRADELRTKTVKGEVKVDGILPAGVARLREEYAKWVTTKHVEDRFGPVLDHGDTADTVGDYETGDEPDEETVLEMTADQRQRIEAKYKEFMDTFGDNGIPPLAVALAHVDGVLLGPEDTPLAMMLRLPAPAAGNVYRWMHQQIRNSQKRASAQAQGGQPEGETAEGEAEQATPAPYAPDQPADAEQGAQGAATETQPATGPAQAPATPAQTPPPTPEGRNS